MSALLIRLSTTTIDRSPQEPTRHIRMVAGLVAFGSVMPVENAAAPFIFLIQMLYSSDPGVQQAVAVLRGFRRSYSPS